LRSDVGEPVIPQLERAQVSEWRKHTWRQVSDLIVRQVEVRHADKTSERCRGDVSQHITSHRQRPHLY